MSIQDTLYENSDFISDNYAEILSGEEFNVDAFCDQQEALDHIQIDLLDLDILDVDILQDSKGRYSLR
ncbi:MAG: hypothetical protein V3V22_01585 [Methylococcales bacterium]